MGKMCMNTKFKKKWEMKMKTVYENENVWVKADLNARLRKTAYKAGLVSHNVDFWRVPPLADKSGSLCLNCT